MTRSVPAIKPAESSHRAVNTAVSRAQGTRIYLPINSQGTGGRVSGVLSHLHPNRDVPAAPAGNAQRSHGAQDPTTEITHVNTAAIVHHLASRAENIKQKLLCTEDRSPAGASVRSGSRRRLPAPGADAIASMKRRSSPPSMVWRHLWARTRERLPRIPDNQQPR